MAGNGGAAAAAADPEAALQAYVAREFDRYRLQQRSFYQTDTGLLALYNEQAILQAAEAAATAAGNMAELTTVQALLARVNAALAGKPTLAELLARKNASVAQEVITGLEILAQGEAHPLFWDVLAFKILLFVMDGNAHDKIYPGVNVVDLMRAVLSLYPTMPKGMQIDLKAKVQSTSDAKAKVVLRAAIAEVMAKIGWLVSDSDHQQSFALTPAGADAAVGFMGVAGQNVGILIDSLKGDWMQLIRGLQRVGVPVGYVETALSLTDPFTKKPHSYAADGVALLANSDPYTLPGALGLPAAQRTVFSRVPGGNYVQADITMRGGTLRVVYHYEAASIETMREVCRTLQTDAALDQAGPVVVQSARGGHSITISNAGGGTLRNLGSLPELLLNVVGLKTAGDENVWKSGCGIDAVAQFEGAERQYAVTVPPAVSARSPAYAALAGIIPHSAVRFCQASLDELAILAGLLGGETQLQFNGDTVTVTKGAATAPVALAPPAPAALTRAGQLGDLQFLAEAHKHILSELAALTGRAGNDLRSGLAVAGIAGFGHKVIEFASGSRGGAAAPAVEAVARAAGVTEQLRTTDLQLTTATFLRNLYSAPMQTALGARGALVHEALHPSARTAGRTAAVLLASLKAQDTALDASFNADPVVPAGRLSSTSLGEAVRLAIMVGHVNPTLAGVFPVQNVLAAPAQAKLINLIFRILRQYYRLIAYSQVLESLATDMFADPVGLLTPQSKSKLWQVYDSPDSFSAAAACLDTGKLLSDRSIVMREAAQLATDTKLNLADSGARIALFKGIRRLFLKLGFRQYAADQAAIGIVAVLAIDGIQAEPPTLRLRGYDRVRDVPRGPATAATGVSADSQLLGSFSAHDSGASEGEGNADLSDAVASGVESGGASPARSTAGFAEPGGGRNSRAAGLIASPPHRGPRRGISLGGRSAGSAASSGIVWTGASHESSQGSDDTFVEGEEPLVEEDLNGFDEALPDPQFTFTHLLDLAFNGEPLAVGGRAPPNPYRMRSFILRVLVGWLLDNREAVPARPAVTLRVVRQTAGGGEEEEDEVIVPEPIGGAAAERLYEEDEDYATRGEEGEREALAVVGARLEAQDHDSRAGRLGAPHPLVGLAGGAGSPAPRAVSTRGFGGASPGGRTTAGPPSPAAELFRAVGWAGGGDGAEFDHRSAGGGIGFFRPVAQAGLAGDRDAAMAGAAAAAGPPGGRPFAAEAEHARLMDELATLYPRAYPERMGASGGAEPRISDKEVRQWLRDNGFGTDTFNLQRAVHELQTRIASRGSVASASGLLPVAGSGGAAAAPGRLSMAGLGGVAASARLALQENFETRPIDLTAGIGRPFYNLPEGYTRIGNSPGGNSVYQHNTNRRLYTFRDGEPQLYEGRVYLPYSGNGGAGLGGELAAIAGSAPVTHIFRHGGEGSTYEIIGFTTERQPRIVVKNIEDRKRFPTKYVVTFLVGGGIELKRWNLEYSSIDVTNASSPLYQYKVGQRILYGGGRKKTYRKKSKTRRANRRRTQRNKK